MSSEAPKVVCVAVRTGNLVDQVIFCFNDGTYTVYGHTGGNIPQRWNLSDGDYIVQINVRQGSLLDAIQFVTARGKVSPLFGGRGGSYKEFRVEKGCEVVGLLMQRYKCGEEYPVANGVVGGLVSRAVGGAIPPLYFRIGGLRRLDVGCSPSTGYSYEGVRDVEMNVVLYRSDLEKALKNRDLDPKVKDAIVKILDFPGAQFVGKIGLGQIVKAALDAGFTGEPLPIGLIQQLKTKGLCAGVQGFIQESLQTNTQILGGLAGVLLAHIVAPIYAAKGEGEKAATLAAGSMIGLGAAIAVGGAAAIGIGLIAPLAIAGIFKVFGETASALDKRWKQDMYQRYQTFSEPLGKELSRVKNVKCPNGHCMIDDGPPTLAYLADKPPFRQSCNAGISRQCCTRDSRWQFRTVRFYCPYCALCYCEPCMLSHIRDGNALPPRVLWK